MAAERDPPRESRGQSRWLSRTHFGRRDTLQTTAKVDIAAVEIVPRRISSGAPVDAASSERRRKGLDRQTAHGQCPAPDPGWTAGSPLAVFSPGTLSDWMATLGWIGGGGVDPTGFVSLQATSNGSARSTTVCRRVYVDMAVHCIRLRITGRRPYLAVRRGVGRSRRPPRHLPIERSPRLYARRSASLLRRLRG